MAKKKTRRTRSSHPGVKLKKRTLPSGGFSWRAHWIDPDTGKEDAITLRGRDARTAEARRLWAIHKAEQLARVRMDRAAGIEPPPVGPPVGEAIDAFVKAAEARLRPRTLAVYGTAFERLRAWASGDRVARTSDLDRPRLVALRDHLIQVPKHETRGGARKAKARGEDRERTKLRSAVTVNGELRALKTLVTAWRRRGLTPALSRDDIADALAALPVDREQPAFLLPTAIKKLLEAAQRHDAACFAETREEHAGRRPRGTTPRYAPIAPFVAFVLLTGCRRNEALHLTWDAVDLDAPNANGEKAGEIRLAARATKTRTARTIYLEVSPALRRMLARLRLANGGRGHVFGGDEPYTPALVESTRRRLLKSYGAPPFDWQTLRSTCGTYLTNAPGIFGAASVYMSAKQLGHSVAVAERHYLGVYRGIPCDAKSLEAAMGISIDLATPPHPVERRSQQSPA